MNNLTPITREEILMNDEPLTPITREEKILAGEDLNPVTRREYFLKKYRHAGGDVMVEELEVTANGTYTAPEGKAYSPVEVAVPMPENAYLLKEASGSLVSFDDGADLPMPSFICNIDAVQGLHGYDHPWVGGAGKNKLEVTATTQTKNGVTFTVNSDGTIILNGTATEYTFFNLNYVANTKRIPTGSYIFSGMISGITTRVYQDGTAILNYGGTTEQPFEISSDAETTYARIDISTGTTFNNVAYRPMIRLATETDATFAPYSNICPISGHTGLDAWVRGKNKLFMTVDDIKAANGGANTWTNNEKTINGITFTILTDKDNNVIGVKANGTANTSGTVVNFYLQGSPFNLPTGNYILSGTLGGGSNTYRINARSSGTIVKANYDGDSPFTLAEDTYTKTTITITNGVTVNNVIFYPMIRLSTEIDPTYEPYNTNSQTIQVSWQTEAGEVFGGYVDLVSGVLTAVVKYKLFDGSENWTITSNIYLELSDMKSGPRQDGLCNYFPVRKSGDSGDNLKIQFGANGVGANSLYIINAISSGYDTLEKVQALTTGMQIVYPLAEVQTYQLTATQIKSLLGNNNAWCSTGDVDIDYFAKEVTG